MNDSLALTALSLIDDIEKLNWNDHSMGQNQKADKFFKRKNKFDNNQQLQKSFVYQKSKRKIQQKSINKSFVLQKNTLEEIGEQIIPRIKQEFANNVRYESQIRVNKYYKNCKGRLAMTLIFNYCKKMRKLYYFNKFFNFLKFRNFLTKLNFALGRIYYSQLSTSLNIIKNDSLQEKYACLQKVFYLLSKKTVFLKAQSMTKIQIFSKKETNRKFSYVFMLIIKKTINSKQKYLKKEVLKELSQNILKDKIKQGSKFS